MNTSDLKIALGLSATLVGLFVHWAEASPPLLHYTFDGAATGTTQAVDHGLATAAPGVFNGNSVRTDQVPRNFSGGAASTGGGGSFSYISAATPAKLTELESFTLTLWVNIQSNVQQYDRLISMHSASVPSGFDFFLTNPSGTSASPRLAVDSTDVTASITDSGSTNVWVDLGVSNWVFLCVSYDGSQSEDNVHFYWAESDSPDAEVVQLGVARSLDKGAVDSTTADLRIGGTNRTSQDRTPDALFDDVRIYGEVLDLEELQGIFWGESVPESPNLMLLQIGGE